MTIKNIHQKQQKTIKAAEMKVGDTGIIKNSGFECYDEHLVIRTFCRLISLSNPRMTWSNIPDFNIELCDIEIKVL